MLDMKHFFSAVNRIYYALFYEISALLMTKDISPHRHTGVRANFNQHFVKTGLIDKEIGKFYSRMFDFRQEGDYDDFIYFIEDDVKEWFIKAEKYMKVLDGFIDNLILTPIHS